MKRDIYNLGIILIVVAALCAVLMLCISNVVFTLKVPTRLLGVACVYSLYKLMKM